MHNTAILFLEFGAVVLGLGILGALALRVGISPIPLYLLAGLAFGTGGILPLATSEEFTATGAELGVILLLLTLGLEYNADELVTSLKGNARAGLVDLVLNAAPGAILALLLGWGPVAAVAMAGVTYATSSGITAKVLSDLGWIGNRETPVVLSLLVFEDLTMAVYLPVLTAMLAGLSLVAGAVAVAVALVAVSVVLLVALRFGRYIEAFVASPNSEVLVLKVVGLALLVAGLAQQLQVSAAVGAFLVGIALSGELAEDAQVLLAPLRDLFAAVFFVFFGLQTDPTKILPSAGLAAGLALVTMITKLLTGIYAARRAGIARAGRVRAGIALIPRGEFNIVIAGLAVAAGAHPDLGALAATYVLILAAFGPLAARLVQPLLTRVASRA
ncbi:cation:proton antiporter [Microbispora bryophytorum]|uniref:Potassium transporter n=2 Tax=Microbispora bryophytorum TaxID=1460882 RepID=A0A8H9GY11_9ACTN|nr:MULTISPECIES: cation:proton antiporter [Microbispora]MBD3141469.1 cation:proton antiporter [Microbispora bryophytorum]MBD3148507.1 cation:proton antiporter [Microbispora camponoti]TQR98449.1 cation:proton antiporter [Microbispora bryophytorum]GGO08859.1 potassium transporter [Microbispora bryophytorum]